MSIAGRRLGGPHHTRDPFQDALPANTGPSIVSLAASADSSLAAMNPTQAGRLDPAVDGPVPPTDADAFTDLAQAVDPNAFTTAGVPSDFVGTLAAGLGYGARAWWL
ncbi:hypothetical protein [Mycobacterium sp.]|uniref:hypothetical protein n=1 Tax=Mycobacterium sp. TaxID=1785 RepID=UPI003D098618